jgi:predicted enzyme related to lactoylglutathione lyase
VEAAEFILYVAGQARAKAFYRHVLTAEPALDVPGMTEFSLGGATLGLMPAADMEDLLAGQIRGGTGQRCELYLRRADAAAALGRAADGGGKLLDGLRDRSSGERVATRWTRTATSWPSRCPPGRPARWSGPGSIGART